MKKILSILLTPLFYLAFALNLLFFHVYQVIALNIFGHKAHDRSVAQLNYFLMKMHLILGNSYTFNGFKTLSTDKPVIILANHQSMWDIPPLVWKFRKHRLKFIAKKELAKGIPSISYNLKYGGSVCIDRKNPIESKEKIKEFAKMIADKKYGVGIFPEGSRSKDGKLKPFKIGGLATIIKEMPDVLIVPVAIKNTYKVDNHGSKFLNVGVKITYTCLTPRSINLENIEAELEAIKNEMKPLVEN